MARSRLFFSRRWRSWKAVWVLFAVEFLFTIPALALFAIAQPNLYRTRLWKDGFDNGFNSNPLAPIYAIVNGKTFVTPIVWRQFITDYNVIISVLSMFFLLVKGVMFIMHLFLPIIGVFIHGGLTALWAYSMYAQTSPDNTDPRFPKLGAPWYIVKGCGVAKNKSLVGYCMQAKAALAVTVIMLFLCAANTALALWSSIPSKSERLARRTSLSSSHDASSMSMKFDAPPTSAKQRSWSRHASSHEKKHGSRFTTRGEDDKNNRATGAFGGDRGDVGGYESRYFSSQSHYVPDIPPTPGTAAALLSPGSKGGMMGEVPTPRTMAFQRLGGMNTESSGGTNAKERSSDLPLRSQ